MSEQPQIYPSEWFTGKLAGSVYSPRKNAFFIRFMGKEHNKTTRKEAKVSASDQEVC